MTPFFFCLIALTLPPTTSSASASSPSHQQGGAATNPHLVQAWDCQKPIKTSIFDVTATCDPAGVPGEAAGPVAEFVLVQRVNRVEARGYKCSVTRARRLFYCGLWSYEKALGPTSATEPFSISAAECEYAVRTKKIQLPNSELKHPVYIPGYTSIEVKDIGISGIRDGSASCVGGAALIGDQMVEGMVESSHYIIKITEEVFEFIGSRSIATFAHEDLTCRMEAGGCAGITDTYVWTNPGRPCPYVKVRQFKGIRDNDVVMGINAKVGFNLTGDRLPMNWRTLT